VNIGETVRISTVIPLKHVVEVSDDPVEEHEETAPDYEPAANKVDLAVVP
jgi:hypothetical protein